MPGKRKVVQLCDRCDEEKEHFVTRFQDRAGVTRDLIAPVCRECKRDEKKHRIVYRGRDTQKPDKLGKWIDHQDEGAGLETGSPKPGRKRAGGTLAMQDPTSATQCDPTESTFRVDAAVRDLLAGYSLRGWNRLEWAMQKGFKASITDLFLGGWSNEEVAGESLYMARRAVLDALFPDWAEATGADAEWQRCLWFNEGPIYEALGVPLPKPTLVLNKDGDIRPVKQLTPDEKREQAAEEMRLRWGKKARPGPRPKNNRP